MIEKGNMLYSSPPNNRNKRIIVIFLYLIFICIASLIFYRYFTVGLSNIDNIYDAVFSLMIIVMLIFGILILITVVETNILAPKVVIYENGISRFKVWKILEKEGEFVPYSNMRSFSVSKQINPGQTCRVELNDPKDDSIIWTSKKPEHILPIIEALKVRNISETD